MRPDNHVILIILCLIVLVSHIFDMISKAIKIPSALLLLGSGVVLKYVSVYFNFNVYEINKFVPFLGIMGLIFIVLEGSLDLKIKRKDIPLIRRSFFSALLTLFFSATCIGALLIWRLDAGLKASFVNAIPFAVISSAIAIPTVLHLTQNKREFIVYESIFSDILGIMLFNAIIFEHSIGIGMAAGYILKTLVLILIALLFSFILMFLISKSKTPVKFYIILSSLVLIYSVGKLFHLSSLLLIFVFGLILNNYGIFMAGKLNNLIDQSRVDNELGKFRLIVTESTFLIRTFFFVLFGYSIDLFSILNKEVIFMGGIIVLILLAVRYVYLRGFLKVHLFPEIFIAPRGLVTILLFYSIPKELMLGPFGYGEMLFVIVATNLLMILAFLFGKTQKEIGGDILYTE